MPLTDYQKSWVLQKAGYDPSKYTVDDDGSVSELATSQPTLSADSMVPSKPSDVSPSPSPSNGYSPLQTGAMSFGQSAPSAVGGGLGAAGGLAAASWLLGPEVGLPVSLAFMLGGGLAGSAIARKGQSAIEPEGWTKAVDEASAENPKSAVTGQIASIPLSGFSPSPSNLLRGVGAGAKILTGMEATAPEMLAGRNLLFNSALGAAQPSINYAVGQGPAPTLGSTLEGAGMGALFSKSNVIGDRLGFGEPIAPATGIDEAALRAALADKNQQTQTAVNPNPSAMGLSSMLSAYGAPSTRGDIISGSARGADTRSDKMADYASNPEQPTDTFEGEGGMIPKQVKDLEEAKAESNQRTIEYLQAQNEIRAEEIRRANIQRDTLSQQNDAAEQTVNTTPGDFLGHELTSLGDNLNRPELAQNVKLAPGGEPSKMGLEDKTLPVVGAEESTSDLATRQEEARLAGEPRVKYQEDSQIPDSSFPANHLSVKETIDDLQKRTDDASVTEDDARKAHWLLQHKIDWSTMPEVGKELNNRGFDPLDPIAWLKVQDEYNKALNAAKPQAVAKPDIAPVAEAIPAKISPVRIKEPALQAKNPAIRGDKALEDIKGSAPKPIGPNDLQPKESEKISPNSSEGLRQIWKEIDAGNGRAAMNRIEYAYKDANPDTRSVLHAQMHVLKTKYGIEPSEQFHTDNPRYQENTQAQEIQSKLDDQGISTGNIKQWNSVISKWAKSKFGIEIGDDGTITNSKTGKPVAGAAYLRNALREAFIKINPDKAKIDTLPHELHHVFMDYLERFGSASDKKFIARAYAKVESTPEFQAAKAKNPSLDANEFLASRGGLEFIDRQLNLSGDNEWKTFWKDYMAHLKDKFTSKATLEDYSRLLNYKMIHDPLHEGSVFNGVGNTTVKNQDVEPSADKVRYTEIQNRMSDLIKQDNVGEEFKNLWKEMEDIKNKTEGMPPKNQDESELGLNRKGEGRTPYPFSLKEFNKGEEVLNDVHDTDLAGKNGELFHIDNPDINTKNQDYSQFALTKSLLDKAESKAEQNGAPKEGKDFSKAIRSFYPLKEQLQGKYMEPIREASQGMKQSGINKVENTLLEEFRTKQNLSGTLNGKERKLYDAIRASYNTKQNDQIAANQPVTDYNAQGKPFQRLPKIDPYYHVNRISPKVTEKLISGTMAEKAALKAEFLQWQAQNGISPSAAQDKLNSVLEAYDTGKPNLSKFAANRKAEGVGLPDSWLRKGDLLRTLNNYYNRVSSDRAWHDTVESNSDVATSLGVKNDPWGNAYNSTSQDISSIPEVKDITDNITGEPFRKNEATIKGLNRIASSLMLGPLTNVHIAAGSFANSLQYLHPGELPSALKDAISNLVTNWTKVYETGYHKKDYTTIKDLTNANMTGLEKMNSLSSFISNLSGRQGMNHFTKSLLQGMGEYLVKNRAIEANNGNVEAIKLMKQIDPEWSQGKIYTGKTLDNAASNFASYIHGAHDARTLPGWILKDSAIQPFFSLASWNVAQTNAWMKHVWTPAKEGNFTPLIMSTLGSVLGGHVVKNLREELADKKSPIPSLTELMKSSKGLEGNIPLVAYNLMAMSSYTGYAGILSVAAKAVQDVAFKNIPQGAAFPLYETISNPIHRASQFLSAMYNDPNFDYLQAGTKFALDMTRENFQLGRIMENWAADKTDILGENAHYEKNVNDALGDLRRFKMAEDMPYEDETPSEANPYTDRTLKEFKRTSNLGVAAKDLPSLISTAFKESNGNIEVLKSELAKIKQNNFETMPSPTNIPRTFLTYLNYLRNAQGEDVASERLTQYLTQEGINKVKSSMVPKF